MKITIIEYGGIERHINCKSFEARTNQVENWIKIKYQDDSKEMIYGVATIKAESEGQMQAVNVDNDLEVEALKKDNEKMADLLIKQLTIISAQEKEINNLKTVLDKIRAEIEQTTSRYCISRERGYSGQVEWSDRLIKESEVLEIIDKYNAESEE